MKILSIVYLKSLISVYYMFVKCLVKYINNISQFLLISTEILINVSGSIDKCIKNAYGDRLKVYIIHLLFDLENHSFR